MDMLDTSTMVDFEDENSSMTYMPPCDLFDISNFSRHLLPPFYYAIFIISLLGNGLVLYILFKFEKINTVTNVFLINLVASDLIFTLGLPFQAVYHSSEWSFGQVGCKVMNGTYHLGFYSSVLFLTLLTFDRYLAVVHAVAAVKWRQSCYAYFSAMVVWIVSGLTSLETFLNHDVTDDIVQGLTCTDMGDPERKIMGTYSQVALFFIFPLVVVLYCYIMIGLTVLSTRMRSKQRPLKLIFVILVLFFMCWTPYNVILLLTENENRDPCDYSLIYYRYVTHSIANLYFCINPMFYTFLGRKFQNHVRRMLVDQVPCLKNHLHVSESSRSFSR
ncbi:probable C-C chemokine receptor type 3 [Hemibagrus wyckioides]|uniref:probable C-C chemokine receptor type 3 n=1 Tax=Hemibagrus wyckioides TaxID=337641 RepID=UPI00266DD548|nr:probable C-C chemokine receptor type 3 [Hemibagrus wyckioides]